jgi:hypothetical protein
MGWRHLYEALSAGRAVYSSFRNLWIWNKDKGGKLRFNLCDCWGLKIHRASRSEIQVVPRLQGKDIWRRIRTIFVCLQAQKSLGATARQWRASALP